MSLLKEVETNEPITDLSRKTVGIYGRGGIGKSTLASFFEGAFFAATESGIGHLSVPNCIVTHYSAPLTKKHGNLVGGFKELCNEFLKGDHPYKTLVIDTFDNLCKICTEWQCNELGIPDIGSYKKFGAYHLVTAELSRVIKILSDSPYGLVLISHVTQEEIETPTKKYNHNTISSSGKNKPVMIDICDPLLFMDSRIKGDQEVGVIRTKPSIYWEAKDKLKVLPSEIVYPLDQPEKAYQLIESKFNNYAKERKEVA